MRNPATGSEVLTIRWVRNAHEPVTLPRLPFDLSEEILLAHQWAKLDHRRVSAPDHVRAQDLHHVFHAPVYNMVTRRGHMRH